MIFKLKVKGFCIFIIDYKAMKRVRCEYPKCNNKIKDIYKDMWKCKCSNYYCNEHKAIHGCIALKEKIIMETIIPVKVNKI